MRGLRVLPVAVVLILGALAACAVVEEARPPQVRLADIRMLEGGLLEQRFLVDLRIGNPNDFALSLDGLTFELELNERRFAQGLSDESVTIPRLSEASVPLVASTTLVDMLQQVLVLAERADLTYRMSGVVYLSGTATRSVDYERSGKLEFRPARAEQRRTLVPL